MATTRDDDPSETPSADPGLVGTRLIPNLTDLGNAERLVKAYGQDLHYCPALGWLVWDGRRWKIDATERVMALAGKTARKVQASALKITDEKRRHEMMRWGLHSESKYALEAMVALTKSQDGILVSADALDVDPWKLTVQNGTLDLKTGILHPHRREDLISKLSPVTYDSTATCPTWARFLDRIMGGDQKLIAYLQALIGYTLTGNTKEKGLFLLHGEGDNGKSTLINVLHALLGGYGRTAQTETLLVKKGETPGNDLARLKGARFVSAVETKDGKRLNEGLVKQLTGGDPVTVRFLYREHFEYVPSYKLYVAVNHLPIIGDTGYAMWERIHVVPFLVTIPKAEQDKGLEDKLKTELPGILRWAVQGCLAWQEHGLKKPAAVIATTDAYRSDMDTCTRFLSECCVLDPKAHVPVADLYDAYKRWEDGWPLGGKVFGNRLRKLGLEQLKGTGGKREWQGIGLLSGDGGDSGKEVEKVPVEEARRTLVKSSPLSSESPLAPSWAGFWAEPIDHETLAQALRALEGISEEDLDAQTRDECEATGGVLPPTLWGHQR